MTEIAFHFNAPDKLGYVCRFVRKALRHGARVAIVAPPARLGALSQRLWKSAPQDFLAHSLQGDAPQVWLRSPVVLLEAPENSPHQEILVNLNEELPSGYERFARVVEIVSAHDEMDRAQARARWRAYAAQGHPIQRHDLVLQER